MGSNEDIKMPEAKRRALDDLNEFKAKIVEVNTTITECINIFDVAIDNAWESDIKEYDGNVFILVVDLVGHRSAAKVLDLLNEIKD